MLRQRQAAIFGAPEHSDRIVKRIDEPVLAHAAALEQVAFELLVLPTRPRRQNLDDQRWRALHVLFRQDVELIAGDEKQVGLDDVELREDHVEGREKDPPEMSPCRQMRGNRDMQSPE